MLEIKAHVTLNETDKIGMDNKGGIIEGGPMVAISLVHLLFPISNEATSY